MSPIASRAFRYVACASLVAVLAACGGGGGGGDAPIVVPDGQRVEDASANSDVNAGNFDALAGPLARLVISGGGNPRQTDPNSASQNLSALMRGSMQKLRASGKGRAQAQAVFHDTQGCPGGGSLTTDIGDLDGDGFLSSGDGVNFAFSNCSIDGIVPAADGSYSITVRAVDYDASDNVIGLIVDGRYDNLSIGSVARLNGAFHIWDTWSASGVEHYRISYANVSSAFLTQSVTYNFDIEGAADASGNTFAIDGALGINGETFRIVQDRAVFNSDGTTFPSSGILYLKDVRGDTLRLIARSATLVDFDYTPIGATSPTYTLYGQRWDDFE